MSKHDLTALADAVEQAWAAQPGVATATEALWSSLYDWSAARRAARADGYRECLLSREAVEALRVSHLSIFNAEEACKLLACDLGPLLKETP
jgi:hypothetical protein